MPRPSRSPVDQTTVTVWRPAASACQRVFRIVESSRPWTGYNDSYAMAVFYSGAVESRYRRKERPYQPGMLDIKEPGEVHRELRIQGRLTMQVAMIGADAVGEAANALGLHGHPHFCPEPRDNGQRATRLAFEMHRVLSDRRASTFEVECRVTEALVEVLSSCIEQQSPGAARHSPLEVSRAREFLHAHVDSPLSLDDMASHAGLDKFHLARAFRDHVGMAPYEYLTQLRVARAAELLSRGMRSATVAQEVGLYDESQLYRHFRRILGMSPGRFARAVAPGPRPGRRR